MQVSVWVTKMQVLEDARVHISRMLEPRGELGLKSENQIWKTGHYAEPLFYKYCLDFKIHFPF